jgi:hypothetical protein
MERLHTLSKPLAESLLAATPDLVRRAVVHACELAWTKLGVEDELLRKGLSELTETDTIAADTLRSLEQATEEFDLEYLKLGKSRSVRSKQRSHFAFNLARFAAALCFAAESDCAWSGLESIYEAAMSLDEPDEMVEHLATLSRTTS